MGNYEEIFESLFGDPEKVIEVIDQYKPLLYKFASVLFEVYKDYVNNTEISDYSAKALANKYNALINHGFTEDQAFLLLLDSETIKRESLRNLSRNSRSKSNG